MPLKKEKVEEDLSVSTSHIDNDDSKNLSDFENEDNDSSDSSSD
jgi:hypothetical protein